VRTHEEGDRGEDHEGRGGQEVRITKGEGDRLASTLKLF
jgi:hypothetical protein